MSLRYFRPTIQVLKAPAIRKQCIAAAGQCIAAAGQCIAAAGPCIAAAGQGIAAGQGYWGWDSRDGKDGCVGRPFLMSRERTMSKMVKVDENGRRELEVEAESSIKSAGVSMRMGREQESRAKGRSLLVAVPCWSLRCSGKCLDQYASFRLDSRMLASRRTGRTQGARE
jgi:hypothetical protein